MFLSFLDDEALLGPGAASVDRLIEVVTSLAEEFVAVMGDRPKFGLAKSMFAAATEEGVDMTDPDELHAWMERFDELPEVERYRLLPDAALSSPPPRRSLPPVALPAEDDVAASREAAPILSMSRDLADCVGRLREAAPRRRRPRHPRGGSFRGRECDGPAHGHGRGGRCRRQRGGDGVSAVPDPGQAAAEMSDAVRELDDPVLRVLGPTILGEIGSDVALSYVRELALELGTRGFALCWPVAHGRQGDAIA
ncbi:MAG: hypothetical protein ACYDDZ_02760 [Acidimicrobiales bacterium]